MNNNIINQRVTLMKKMGGNDLNKPIQNNNTNRSGERKQPNNNQNKQNNIKPKGCGSCRRNKSK